MEWCASWPGALTAESSGASSRPSAAAAGGGEAAEFATRYRDSAPLVYAVLVASVPRAEAEDLMQEVYLAAWQGIARLRRRDRFQPWLLGIARNCVRRWHRNQQHRPRPLTLVEDPAAPEQGAGRRRCDRVLAVLRGLPPGYREVLALRLIERQGGGEIARATGLRPGSVRVKLCRGMEMLRARLNLEKSDE